MLKTQELNGYLKKWGPKIRALARRFKLDVEDVQGDFIVELLTNLENCKERASGGYSIGRLTKRYLDDAVAHSVDNAEAEDGTTVLDFLGAPETFDLEAVELWRKADLDESIEAALGQLRDGGTEWLSDTLKVSRRRAQQLLKAQIEGRNNNNQLSLWG